ncbi:hypothetical protein K3X41_11285 [Aliiroseovarius crassostreae]|uniref:hypothetical protein n=1 Tax=Aliiroseovarius crassostreae TaxID=154981 RepID=UPI0021FDC9FB|nr:hypothetical protein [Aliiroseovarius crassostreae]UWQ10479.1 hypothetical protein K3X41_11285 [Aliiroseovarius crassostreae]
MEPPYPDPTGDEDTAFLRMEQGFRQALDEDVHQKGRDPLRAQLAYVNKVLAAADALGIQLLSHLTRPEIPLLKDAGNLNHLRDEIDHTLVALRLKFARHDPVKPRHLPEDQHHRLLSLLSSITAEIENTRLPQTMDQEARQVLSTLRGQLETRTLRMEHFVDLGRVIASIGRQPETEAVADKCWQWLRLSMDLLSRSKGSHRPFAHLNDGVATGG